jgi:hypothetical protein
MVVAERELMLARRAQSRFRRKIEANGADAFVHLAPRRELNSRQRERRAPSIHFERDILQHASRISLLFRRRNLSVAVDINQR